MAITPPTASRHLLHWRAFLAPTPCARFADSFDQIQCLRELPAVGLSQANTRAKMYVLGVHQAASWRSPTFFPFWPTLDKDFITKSPFELWKEGNYKDVPLLMGNVVSGLSLQRCWRLLSSAPPTDSSVARRGHCIHAPRSAQRDSDSSVDEESRRCQGRSYTCGPPPRSQVDPQGMAG